MKAIRLPKSSRWILAAAGIALFAGCVTPPPPPLPTNAYIDQKHKFSLSLPAGVKHTKPGANGEVTFTGFAVPAGTNLESKTLIIALGAYDLLQGAKPPTDFTFGGVAFQRVLVDDGSAGHSTLHVIYTCKTQKSEMHFDFTHRAVNVLNFDPPNRPKEYDRAAQIKLTEETMRTFHRL